MQPNAVKTDILWCSSQREVDQLPTKPGDVGGSSVVRRTRPQCMDRQWSHNVHSHHQGRRQLRCVRRSLQCHMSALRSSFWHSCCPDWTSATVSWQDCPRTNLTATAVSSPCSNTTRLRRPSTTSRDTAASTTTERVEFKLCVLAYRCLHGLGPAYLSCDLKSVSASTTALVVPATRRSMLGDHAFPAAAARTWNALPHEVPTSPSLSSFRRLLKTHLFCRSFCYD